MLVLQFGGCYCCVLFVDGCPWLYWLLGAWVSLVVVACCELVAGCRWRGLLFVVVCCKLFVVRVLLFVLVSCLLLSLCCCCLLPLLCVINCVLIVLGWCCLLLFAVWCLVVRAPH